MGDQSQAFLWLQRTSYCSSIGLLLVELVRWLAG